MTTIHAAPLITGYRARAATVDDAPAIANLIAAHDLHFMGTADTTVEEVTRDWTGPNFSLAEDSYVILSDDHQLVGYGVIFRIKQDLCEINVDGYIHLDHLNRGLGTLLLRNMEMRAREIMEQRFRPDQAVSVQSSCFSTDENANAMFLTEGYHLERVFYRMTIQLTEAPAPVWPAGIRVRSMNPDADYRAVYHTVIDSFQDHWGFSARPLEDWRKTMMETSNFDPTLWFIAEDEGTGEIAGISLCAKHGEDGWVNTLGVLRPWRKQGLGMALLQHSFGEFVQRGLYSVGLGVDAQSLTGATRLYERAGMTVSTAFHTYQKALR